VEIANVAEHQEIPKEEAAVESIGALEDRYGDRHLAVGHRRQPKKRTQGDSGSRQKLVAARGWLTRRAIPAPRKGHGRQGPGKDMYAELLKDGRSRRDSGATYCSNGIKDQGAIRQLRLKKVRPPGSGIRGRIRRENLRLGSEQSGFPSGCGK
jgi:hypothetical protein